MKKSEVESKERILLAAKREFADNGFNGTRIDAIAKRAGVNKALIHYYFGTKEDLYRHMRTMVFGLGAQGEAMIYLPQIDLSPPQKLYLIMYFLIELYHQPKELDLFRLVFWEMVEGNNLHEEVMREHRIPQVRIIEEIINDGITKGDFETPDPRLYAMFIFSFLDMYMLERDVHGGSGLFRELYGDVDDHAMREFLLYSIFKGLSPGKKTEVPRVPEELIELADQLVESVVKKIGGGYSQVIFEKLKKMLMK